jgi:cytoskeletal protein CcmA (bactofilin family)
MFNKPASSSSRPDISSGFAGADMPPVKRGPKVASLVAEGVTLEGGLTGDGELHLDGTIRGDIKVERLMIGETGLVEGSVTADAIECRGRVTGTITAKQVKLHASAHVDGDVTHEELAIEAGAYFQGRSMKFSRTVTHDAPVKAIAPPEPIKA